MVELDCLINNSCLKNNQFLLQVQWQFQVPETPLEVELEKKKGAVGWRSEKSVEALGQFLRTHEFLASKNGFRIQEIMKFQVFFCVLSRCQEVAVGSKRVWVLGSL